MPKRLIQRPPSSAIQRNVIYDVGVAGIHRLFANMDLLKKAKVIIVAAGMEGALPSIVAGIVGVPVIAIPTSVGYGQFRWLRAPSPHAQLVFDRCRLQHRQWVRRGLVCHPGQPPMKLLYLDPIVGESAGACASPPSSMRGARSISSWSFSGSSPLDLPSMTPEKRRKGAVEGTYSRIGESPVHLSIGQMREMIRGSRSNNA